MSFLAAWPWLRGVLFIVVVAAGFLSGWWFGETGRLSKERRKRFADILPRPRDRGRM